MAGSDPTVLELDDIQSGVLRPRPTPYAATYIVFRIDEPRAGRELLAGLSGVVASAAHPTSPAGDTWVSVALTFHGLRMLGVPQPSLDSFAWEFRQGMAARALALGDTEQSGPAHWEHPLGTSDVHVVIAAIAPDTARLEAAVARARQTYQTLAGIEAIWRQDCHALATEREPFGFRDGISHPAIEGAGIPGTNPHDRPLKAGELVLGYPDELDPRPAIPQPDVLGRNGTYVVFRKLHQRVAAFRRTLRAHARDPAHEELIAAKMMGRWRSGAPLARCPLHDDPALGADPARNNDFLYADDPIGYKTPPGSHVRRSNPRDASVAGVVRLHRMIRRGTAYGPELPDGVLEDDGADRGLMFAFVGAQIGRQFEFVQSEWIGGGNFLGLGDAKDPITGAHDDHGASFSYPQRPIPTRLHGLSRFVVTRGGEYCFMPGLRALRWLAEPRR
ncbi:MAG TPA: Dyp-type peroxidase [Kofleriaceae bacterium]|jgi:Dyp-type peroxidase family|nr:Dyp-type peroxidase [Kofleriaceae bacterium]